jgi:hypothetical protein
MEVLNHFVGAVVFVSKGHCSRVRVHNFTSDGSQNREMLTPSGALRDEKQPNHENDWGEALHSKREAPLESASIPVAAIANPSSTGIAAANEDSMHAHHNTSGVWGSYFTLI